MRRLGISVFVVFSGNAQSADTLCPVLTRQRIAFYAEVDNLLRFTSSWNRHGSEKSNNGAGARCSAAAFPWGLPQF